MLVELSVSEFHYLLCMIPRDIYENVLMIGHYKCNPSLNHLIFTSYYIYHPVWYSELYSMPRECNVSRNSHGEDMCSLPGTYRIFNTTEAVILFYLSSWYFLLRETSTCDNTYLTTTTSSQRTNIEIFKILRNTWIVMSTGCFCSYGRSVIPQVNIYSSSWNLS